jgi:hypothetical protein
MGHATGEREDSYTILVGISEGKGPLRRLTMRQRECVDWIHLAEDRVQWQAFVDTLMNLLFP